MAPLGIQSTGMRRRHWGHGKYDEAGQKPCAHCHEVKPLDAFSPKRRKSGSIGQHSRCRPCAAEIWRLANPRMSAPYESRLAIGWTVNTHELAWSAGFFDGEGTTASYISTNHGRTRVLIRFNVRQVDAGPLHRCSRAIGLGRVAGPYRPSGLGKRPIYALALWHFEEVQAAIAMLWRWLSPPKRRQATRALSAFLAATSTNQQPKARVHGLALSG